MVLNIQITLSEIGTSGVGLVIFVLRLEKSKFLRVIDFRLEAFSKRDQTVSSSPL